jgi:chloramphenicol-sensitive protein RarD
MQQTVAPPEYPRRMPLAGALYAALAYGTWGFLPVYWKTLAGVPLLEVLAHRVFGTVIFTALLLAGLRQMPELGQALRSRRERLSLLASGVLIGVNWAVFIWAVGAGRILETSLGYYLNPLVNVLLGTVFLRERLRRAQGISVALAGAGVLVMLVSHGELPWIALALASSFGLYGLLHKLTHVRPIAALAVETGALAPAALVYLLVATEPVGGALVTGSTVARTLLVLAGPVTALPLLWFASAARRLRLSTLGLFQYLAPTLALLVAVLLYGESFTRTHALAFLLIWSALALYTADALQASRSILRSSTAH